MGLVTKAAEINGFHVADDVKTLLYIFCIDRDINVRDD